MERYFSLLQSLRLFSGIPPEELRLMLSCLNARLLRPKKEEYLLLAGDRVTQIGVLLEGSLHVVQEDREGVRTLMTALESGDHFAEALCCAGVEESPVSVVADKPSVVLMLDYRRILTTCPNGCDFHRKLIENMLFVVARKNLLLQSRVEILGKRSLRRKILALLEGQEKQGGGNVTLPYNREQLAEFLCVDRSALSHELSRMRAEGLLDYHKNTFRLLKP